MHKIVLLNKHDSFQAAQLHVLGISTGFISSLGEKFVTALYEAVAEDKNSFGFVAVEDDKVIGFVTFSTNLSKLYKHVVLKKGFKFIFVLAKKIFSWRVIKKVWDNIFYPSKMKKMNMPDAELLSIVVARIGQGRGIGKELIKKGLEECRRRGFDKVKVLVAVENEAANKLYQKCGFELVTQVKSHGIPSNIYIANV